MAGTLATRKVFAVASNRHERWRRLLLQECQSSKIESSIIVKGKRVLTATKTQQHSCPLLLKENDEHWATSLQTKVKEPCSDEAQSLSTFNDGATSLFETKFKEKISNNDFSSSKTQAFAVARQFPCSIQQRWSNARCGSYLVVAWMALLYVCHASSVHGATMDDGQVSSISAMRNRNAPYSRLLQASETSSSPKATSSLDLLTTRCFSQCVEQRLSPEGCQQYIIDEILAVGGHEVGTVDVKIQTPRSSELFDESYWMIEVPVNLIGQMTCDRNDGQTFYPFQWQTEFGPFDVENIDCQGMTAGQCCLAIRQYGKEAFAPASGGYDARGNCLSCFVHQEDLVPVVPLSTTEYQDFEWNNNDQLCQLNQYSKEQVTALDDVTRQTMTLALSALDGFLTNPSCDVFDALLEILYNAATKMFPLSQLIGQLSCQYCYGTNDQPIATLSNDDPMIRQIKFYLQSEIPSSAVNTVIIYTNEEGDIVLTPKLGSSRADDAFQGDNECDENLDDDMEGEGGNRNETPAGDCTENPTLCGSDQFCNAVDEDDGLTFGPESRIQILKFSCAPYAKIDEECEGSTGKKCNPTNAHCLGASSGTGGYYYGGGGGFFPPVGGEFGGGLPPDFGGSTGPLTDPTTEEPSGTCRTLCESDDDCSSEGRWCGFGIPRVCLDFGKTGDQCNLFVSDLNEEIKCNPATHYCRDTWYCVLPDIGGTCAELGPTCQTDDDGICESYSTPDEAEWFCDPFLQRCKPRYKFCDCCSLSSPWETCESGTACGTGDQPESGTLDDNYYGNYGYNYDFFSSEGGQRRDRRRNLRSKIHTFEQKQQQQHRNLEDQATIDMFDDIDDFGNAAICRPLDKPHPP